jgi:hypothetical protein
LRRWEAVGWIAIGWIALRWIAVRWFALRWIALRWIAVRWIALRQHDVGQSTVGRWRLGASVKQAIGRYGFHAIDRLGLQAGRSFSLKRVQSKQFCVLGTS